MINLNRILSLPVLVALLGIVSATDIPRQIPAPDPRVRVVPLATIQNSIHLWSATPGPSDFGALMSVNAYGIKIIDGQPTVLVRGKGMQDSQDEFVSLSAPFHTDAGTLETWTQLAKFLNDTALSMGAGPLGENEIWEVAAQAMNSRSAIAPHQDGGTRTPRVQAEAGYPTQSVDYLMFLYPRSSDGEGPEKPLVTQYCTLKRHDGSNWRLPGAFPDSTWGGWINPETRPTDGRQIAARIPNPAFGEVIDVPELEYGDGIMIDNRAVGHYLTGDRIEGNATPLITISMSRVPREALFETRVPVPVRPSPMLEEAKRLDAQYRGAATPTMFDRLVDNLESQMVTLALENQRLGGEATARLGPDGNEATMF